MKAGPANLYFCSKASSTHAEQRWRGDDSKEEVWDKEKANGCARDVYRENSLVLRYDIIDGHISIYRTQPRTRVTPRVFNLEITLRSGNARQHPGSSDEHASTVPQEYRSGVNHLTPPATLDNK